jgi:hypothetical protein
MNGWIWGIAAVGVGAGVYLLATKSGKTSAGTSKPGEPNPGGTACAQVVTMCADGYQAPTPCDCAKRGGVMTIPIAPDVVPAGMGADPIKKWEPQPQPQPPLYEIFYKILGPNPQPINPMPIASPDQLANALRGLPVIADRT